jgi:hypothetical protein
VTTIRLNEQPRRIAHIEPHRALAVLTASSHPDVAAAARAAFQRAAGPSDPPPPPPLNTGGGGDTETCRIRLFDDTSFSEMVPTYLLPMEMGLSIITADFTQGLLGGAGGTGGGGGGSREGAGGAGSSSGGGGVGGNGIGADSGGNCYVVVGTGFVRPKEPEPVEGRILLFTFIEGSLGACFHDSPRPPRHQ